MNASEIEKKCGDAMKKSPTFRAYAKSHLASVPHDELEKFEKVFYKVNPDAPKLGVKAPAKAKSAAKAPAKVEGDDAGGDA
jgi:hypothetical protein